jgi:hypothetical protein
MKRLLLLLAALLLAGRATAQPVGFQQFVNTQDSGTACSASGTCAVFQPTPTSSLIFQVSGTFSGTLTFEASADGGNFASVLATNLTSGAVGTTTTATGMFALSNPGYLQVRARATAWASGTATVFLARGAGVAKGYGTTFGSMLASDGSCNPAAGGYAFASQSGLAIIRASASVLDFCNPAYSASAPEFRMSGSTGMTFGNGIGILWTTAGGASGTANGAIYQPAAQAWQFTNTAGTAGGRVITSTDGVWAFRGAAGTAGTGDINYGNKISATGFAFANIGTVLTTNGDMAFCTDCTIANPCAGGGSGALAKRLNGVNVCN